MRYRGVLQFSWNVIVLWLSLGVKDPTTPDKKHFANATTPHFAKTNHKLSHKIAVNPNFEPCVTGHKGLLTVGCFSHIIHVWFFDQHFFHDQCNAFSVQSNLTWIGV